MNTMMKLHFRRFLRSLQACRILWRRNKCS